jgi:hypothetical protein
MLKGGVLCTDMLEIVGCEFPDRASLERSWRWPTGALGINQPSGAINEGTVGYARPADDFALPVVCAIVHPTQNN